MQLLLIHLYCQLLTIPPFSSLESIIWECFSVVFSSLTYSKYPNHVTFAFIIFLRSILFFALPKQRPYLSYPKFMSLPIILIITPASSCDSSNSHFTILTPICSKCIMIMLCHTLLWIQLVSHPFEQRKFKHYVLILKFRHKFPLYFAINIHRCH